MHNTIHFIVSGRVQGVFFRATCKNLADRYQITGWVRNMPDGQVEGMATADTAKLQILRDWLRQGPELARVLRLDITEQPLQEFDNFAIR